MAASTPDSTAPAFLLTALLLLVGLQPPGHVHAATLQAALDAEIRPDAHHLNAEVPRSARKTIGIVLYPGFEVLDVYGPLEMWANVPDFDVILIAEQAGPVRSAQGVSTIADYSFQNAPALDIVMVPGGIGTRVELEREPVLAFLRQAHEHSEYTTSVCTGSALLARAGILDGHRATSNKRAFYLAEEQSSAVDWVVDARWVESGKILTSSGVSAGIDMALGLVAKTHGLESARELASALEYVWQEDATDDPFSQYARRAAGTVADTDIALQQSLPAPNAMLDRAPDYLQLHFDHAPDLARSILMLQREDKPGTPVKLSGLHSMNGRDLMISIDQALNSGRYLLTWSTAAQGSDAQQIGSFRFTVRD